MTEQFPINAAATEQRLVEELTGRTAQVEDHHAPDATEAGDPMDPAGADNEGVDVGARVEVDDPRDNPLPK